MSVSGVECFLEDVVRDLHRWHGALEDPDERAAVEDGIVLLTDYRVSELDETLLRRLVLMLRRGRSPVRLLSQRPQAIAAILAQRWQAYIGGTGAAALG